MLHENGAAGHGHNMLVKIPNDTRFSTVEKILLPQDSQLYILILMIFKQSDYDISS